MKRVTWNALFLFLGEAGTRFLGFLVAAVLAKRLGVDGFGQVGFAMSVMAYGVIASKFGLLTVGIREVARDRERAPGLVGNVLSVRLVLGFVALAAIGVFALVVRKPLQVKWLLFLFGTCVILQSLALEWVFNGIERLEFVALGRALTNLVYLGLVLLLVRGPGDLLMVPVAFLAGTGAAVAFLGASYGMRFGVPLPRIDRGLLRRLVGSAWPIGVASVLTQFHVGYAIVGLSLIRGDHDAGLYASAHRLVFFMLMADRVFQAVFFPVVSRQMGRPERLPATTGAALRVIVALSVPVCAACFLLARPLLGFVFGDEFLPAAGILRMLVWFFPLSLLTSLAGYSLLASGRERRFARNTAIGVTLGIAATTAGIMFYGPPGAAVGTLVGEAGLLVLMGIDFLRMNRPRVGWRTLGVLGSGALMVAVLLLLREWNWLLAGMAGAVVYAGTVLASRAVTFSDLGVTTR